MRRSLLSRATVGVARSQPRCIGGPEWLTRAVATLANVRAGRARITMGRAAIVVVLATYQTVMALGLGSVPPQPLRQHHQRLLSRLLQSRLARQHLRRRGSGSISSWARRSIRYGVLPRQGRYILRRAALLCQLRQLRQLLQLCQLRSHQLLRIAQQRGKHKQRGPN